MNTQKLPTELSQSTFADRIKLLIQRVGSATEIARMCGFSEGVVRSWRDGNTDPSRARCVTLARTLGISLVWLVAGEGVLQVDPSVTGPDEQQYSSETATPQRARGRLGHVHALAAHNDNAVDSQRLNTAMQILQSELDLAHSPLTLADNSDMLTNLYEILGANGSSVDAAAILKFNRQLAERIRQAETA